MINYDLFAEQYDAMVKHGGPRKAHRYLIEQLNLEMNVAGKTICDLGCGQGELAYQLSNLGAVVTGIDASQKLLSYARGLTGQVNWVCEDAMTLSSVPDESFDAVVSSLMLMDVSDHLAVFKQTMRILRPGGIFVWMVMHPCFHSPFCGLQDDGSRIVSQYAPQFWKSEGQGTLRSVLGSYHRPISQYVNDFMKAGFILDRFFEPHYEIKPSSAAKRIPDMPNHFGALGRKKASLLL